MLTPFNLVVLFVGMLFLIGLGTFLAGLFVLFRRASGPNVKALATQTARLAQKGLVEDAAGLVGNASDLLDAMNQLVRTTRGVGIFLTLVGLLMMGLSCWFAVQIYRMNL
jgi:hypothetical protein